MDWMNEIGDTLRKYQGGKGTDDEKGAHDDFDRVSRSAPRESIGRGLAAAFRSDRTPPFPQLVATLFSNADPGQRAGIVNTLISTLGPGAIGRFLSGGAGSTASSAVSSIAGSLTGGSSGGGDASGRTNVSPEDASSISTDAVRRMAEEAQAKDPSIMDRLGDFAAQHAGLVKSLGGPAIREALSHVAGSIRR